MTRKKKALVAGGGIVAVFGGLGVVYRADLQLALMVMVITPDQAFTDASSPRATGLRQPPALGRAPQP